MKKLFLTALMCVLTMSTFAQIKSFAVKGNRRGDFGLGVGLTMPVMENIVVYAHAHSSHKHHHH